MATVSAALGNSGATPSIEFDGRVYSFRRFDWQMATELEQWLIGRHSKALAATWGNLVGCGLMTHEQLFDKVADFTHRAVQTGEFAFGSAAMNQVLFGQATMPTAAEIAEKQKATNTATDRDLHRMPGMFKIMALMLGVSEEMVATIYAAKPIELSTKFHQVNAESMPAPKQEPAP